jgi:hypothetical protein
MGFRLGKKGFADRKNADLWKRFLVVYRKHKSILNGKGIIMFKTKV